MKFAIPLKIPEFSPRERLFAMGSGMAICLVCLDLFVLGPWWRHMRHVEQEIGRLERAISTEQQLLSRKESVLADIVAYQDHLRLAGPKETEIANLLREIESLGDESGVTLGEVKPLATEDGGAYQVRSFEVQCEGTLPELVRFLYILQTSTTLYQIDQGGIEAKDQSSARLKGTFRLTSLAVQAPESLLPEAETAQPQAQALEQELSPEESGGSNE